jgi:hypothetical protein
MRYACKRVQYIKVFRFPVPDVTRACPIIPVDVATAVFRLLKLWFGWVQHQFQACELQQRQDGVVGCEPLS